MRTAAAASTTPASQAAQTYTARLGQDTTLTQEGKALAQAAQPSAKSKERFPTSPGVQVFTFAVDGISSHDMMVIQRADAEPHATNVVLYMPDKDGSSFHGFDNLDGMKSWLREVARDPNRLNQFASHFTDGTSTTRTDYIKTTMEQFGQGDGNAIVGPFAHEGDDIFDRFDRDARQLPPSPVYGLDNLKFHHQTPEGKAYYSGQRPDGETVLYTYDAYGNLMGKGDKDNYYFQKNGLNSPSLLTPLTHDQFRLKITQTVDDNVDFNNPWGLYDEFIHHLENPAYGLGDALQVFGAPKNSADAIERGLDNPIGETLVAVNKGTDNWIGKQLGFDEQTINNKLRQIGETAQGFIPVYGQARMLASLTAKALKDEPLTPQEARDYAQMPGLISKLDPAQKTGKPDSESPDNVAKQDKSSAMDASRNTESPTSLSKLATSLRPGDLKAMTKGDKDVYVDAHGGQYVQMREQVYRVQQGSLNPNSAYVVDPRTETLSSVKLDYSRTRSWKIDETPKLLGGAPDGLPGADPLTREAVLEPLSHENTKSIVGSAEINGYHVDVGYDIEKNAFYPISRPDELYIPSPETRHLVRLKDPNRIVTDAQRTATLKALNIDIDYPIDINAFKPAHASPIPHVVQSIWVGNKRIPDHLLENIENNAVKAKSGNNPYEFKLYLTKNSPNFLENQRLIAERAPHVKVLILEDTDFYKEFSNSKYYEPYQAAIDGNHGKATNYSSASDVLRYRLLHHEGGLYMDMDDTILSPPGDNNIAASAEGIVLSSPTENMQLGMTGEFGTGIFGTQKNNPTLDAISDEVLYRYPKNRDIYSYKPDPSSREFNEYMRKISSTTGPHVFSEVIESRLPEIKQVRQAYKLLFYKINGVPESVKQDIIQLIHDKTPLDRIAKTGNEHSWRNSRK